MRWLSLIAVMIRIAAGQNPGIEFIHIEPGDFVMGCAPTDSEVMPDGSYSPCDADEKPSHPVRITQGFDLGKYEVTQSQWEAVMHTRPSRFPGPERPVEQVTFDDVMEFIERMNAVQDGYHYRLPTEAEWEYAARAGSAIQFTPGLRDQAWYGDPRGQTHPVGQKQPNAWGLYDMRGNTFEWVADWYSRDYFRTSPRMDPTGPANGQYHVARGGSWFNPAAYFRASYRYETVQVLRRGDVGFRLVRTPR